MKDINERTIKGFFWTGSGKATELGITWIISIVLARLLSPADYGLMAITSIFIYFINYFNELSIGHAIIQKEDIDEAYLSSAFWFILTMSMVSYGVWCWVPSLKVCLSLSYIFSPVHGSRG